MRVLDLVADVGGTNMRIALTNGARILPETQRKYRNADFATLQAVLDRYMSETDAPQLGAAAIALAGPVERGQASLTNLGWSLTETGLCQQLGTRNGHLLNDLQAQAYALEGLPASALSPILPGEAAPLTSSKLVVNLGTGFNATPVHETASGFCIPASETGHIALPVATPADVALHQALRARFGFASIEDVLSGRGLAQTHTALHRQERSSVDILAAAETDQKADATLAAVIHTLARVISDLALVHLPFGGIYIVGGLGKALLPHLARHDFEKVYRDKGRFSGFVARMPVFGVTDDNSALIGTARFLAAQ